MKKKSKRQIDKPFESNLQALWREFKRCSEMYRPLYHDRLTFLSSDIVTPVSDESWLLFTNANLPDANQWWLWERMPEPFGFGRFSGCPDGLTEFKKLAESATILFDAMEIDLHDMSYVGWVYLLHDAALFQQLPLLRSKIHPSIFGKFDLGELSELAEKWHRTPDGVGDYPLHLSTSFLIHNVFTSSMTLIESVLYPDLVIVTSSLSSAELGESDKPVEDDTTEISNKFPVSFPPDTNVFKRIGNTKMWMVQFVEGGIKPERNMLQEKAGFYYIQKLLSSEKQPVSYLDLYRANPMGGKDFWGYADGPHEPEGEFESVTESGIRRGKGGESGDNDVDEETIAANRKRRRALLDVIDKLKAGNDPKALKDAEDELAFIERYLTSVTDRRGKPRQSSVKTPESVARTCVKKSLTPAMDSLKHLKTLHDFLKTHLVPQGGNGRQYTKAGEITWETS